MATNVRGQGVFRVLVAHLPHGTDPTIPGPLGSPLPERQTVTFGQVVSDGGRAVNGRLVTPAPGQVPGTGTITVASNDFTTGRAELILGEYRLLSNIDYQVGADTDATAAALGAAIATLPGFGATVLLSVVSVTVQKPADQVTFAVSHLGYIKNFTLAPAL